MLERFLALRADKFLILRKKPAHKGYDFSFLITDEHLAKFKKEEIINFILEFIQGIDKEINDMKLAIINQTRMAAAFFTNAVANNPIPKWISHGSFNTLSLNNKNPNLNILANINLNYYQITIFPFLSFG